MNLPRRKRDSKLESFIKHTTMTVECMSDESKYKVTPSNKRKGNQVETRIVASTQLQPVSRHIGLRLPHHDLYEE